MLPGYSTARATGTPSVHAVASALFIRFVVAVAASSTLWFASSEGTAHADSGKAAPAAAHVTQR